MTEPEDAPEASRHAVTQDTIDTQKGPADWFSGDIYIDAVAAPAYA